MQSSSSDTSKEEKKKAFHKKVFKPSYVNGHVDCHFCKKPIWAPNRKHHIDKCPVLTKARSTAKKNNIKLVTVGGVDIDEDLFKTVKPPAPRPAKIDGFVMSSSVLLSDPHKVPSSPLGSSNRGQGSCQRTGRRGYTRCLNCNMETYGPNTSRHICPKNPGKKK